MTCWEMWALVARARLLVVSDSSSCSPVFVGASSFVAWSIPLWEANPDVVIWCASRPWEALNAGCHHANGDCSSDVRVFDCERSPANAASRSLIGCDVNLSLKRQFAWLAIRNVSVDSWQFAWHCTTSLGSCCYPREKVDNELNVSEARCLNAWICIGNKRNAFPTSVHSA